MTPSGSSFTLRTPRRAPRGSARRPRRARLEVGHGLGERVGHFLTAVEEGTEARELVADLRGERRRRRAEVAGECGDGLVDRLVGAGTEPVEVGPQLGDVVPHRRAGAAEEPSARRRGSDAEDERDHREQQSDDDRGRIGENPLS
jgi:hypothetical protein